MKVSCEIVKDLLPLYHDDICSIQSRIAVDEHLQECEDCKCYLASMNNDFIRGEFGEVAEKAKYETFKGIKKKLFKKNVKMIMVSILCTVTALLGLFSFIFHYQMPISYEDGLLNVKKANDGVIDIVFNGDDYYASYGFTKTIEKDGEVQNVAYIYYTDSIWTKYFSNPNNNEKYQFWFGNEIMVDYAKNGKAIKSKKGISAVYYLIGDYEDLVQMSDDEFAKYTQNAILLWDN
ncbi:zf-HC2 domain-containing protein [Aeribacillus pallidus]|uniref:zf-HC2 domain-containing protein n=1 Tax=Aeribacillus pallidus TaxID=33936 RepID=UPI003D22A81A